MKTTVHLPDSLVEQAKQVARAERTTLRALIEDGLRDELASRAGRAPFVLRDESFDGGDLQPEFQGAGWERIRETIYSSPQR